MEGEDDFGSGVASPLTVPFDMLPAVTPVQLRDFAAKVHDLLAEFGYDSNAPTGDMSDAVRETSDNSGAPVAKKILQDALSYIDPGISRDEWLRIIAGVRAANIPGDDDLSGRQKIAEDWSKGLFDRNRRYENTQFKIMKALKRSMWRSTPRVPPVQGGITVGTYLRRSERESGKAIRSAMGNRPLASSELTSRMMTGSPRAGGLSYRSMRDIIPVEIDWLWQDRIAAGKLTLIAGAPDDGKSQIVANLSATISNGGKWPFEEGKAECGAVIWLSAEDTAADITVPRLIAAGANRKLIFELQPTVRVDGGMRTLNIVDDLDDITRMIERIERENNVPKSRRS